MAASVTGAATLSVSSAGAAPAQQLTLAEINSMTGVILGPFSPAGTFPNTKVTGNCPGWLFNDGIGFLFSSVNAHLYRIDPITGMPNGANAEGIATLLDNGSPTPFVGQAHVWFGQNTNANGHFYTGETVSFNGTAADGSTISFSTNPGFNMSVGGTKSPGGDGNANGWGQQNLTCNIVSPS
jgi:hypothetical protein